MGGAYLPLQGVEPLVPQVAVGGLEQRRRRCVSVSFINTPKSGLNRTWTRPRLGLAGSRATAVQDALGALCRLLGVLLTVSTFRVWGLRLGVQDSGVWSSGFRVRGSGFGVQGSASGGRQRRTMLDEALRTDWEPPSVYSRQYQCSSERPGPVLLWDPSPQRRWPGPHSKPTVQNWDSSSWAHAKHALRLDPIKAAGKLSLELRAESDSPGSVSLDAAEA